MIPAPRATAVLARHVGLGEEPFEEGLDGPFAAGEPESQRPEERDDVELAVAFDEAVDGGALREVLAGKVSRRRLTLPDASGVYPITHHRLDAFSKSSASHPSDSRELIGRHHH